MNDRGLRLRRYADPGVCLLHVNLTARHDPGNGRRKVMSMWSACWIQM